MVEAIRPPMITIAMPRIIAALLPMPIPMGTIARMVVRVVMNIGRIRSIPEVRTASSAA